MANLSNINGKFVVEQTTGYVGVGTTDPNYPIEVLNASAEIALNASGGSIYRVQSDSASNFIIRKAGVGDRLVINSAGNATFAGNVGIGISPGENLHIFKSDATALIQASNTSGIAQLQFFPRDASNVAHLQSIKGVDSNLTFLTGGNSGNSYVPTEKMRIDSSGKVGVANTNPSAFNSLGATAQIVIGDADAVSNLTMYSSASGYGSIAFADSNSSGSSSQYSGLIQYYQVDNSMNFYTSAAPRMTILSGGNVGIGTADPDHKLEVVGGLALRNSNSRLYFGTNNGPDRRALEGDVNGTLLQVGEGYTDIALQGDVGIGTTNPHFNLQITGGNATEETVLKLDKGATSDTGGHTTILGLGTEGGSWAKAGIGFERTGSYDIGNIHFLMYPPGLNTGSVSLSDSVMTIKNNGNVGIGDTTPASKLVVAGRVQANSGSEPWAFVSNPTSGNYGGFLMQYGNNTKGVCYYNSNSIIVGSEGAAIPLRFTTNGNYAAHFSGTTGNMHVGGISDQDAKLYVTGGTTLAGTNNNSEGAIRMYGDRKLPQATYFVKRNYRLTASSGNALYSIARQWHDHANWGLGHINVIMWGVYYGKNNFSKADFSCRYGYSGGAADVVANFNPGSMAIPTWTAATQVSGNVHYRDLQITVPAYWQISFEIISPGCVQTYNINNTANNTVYLYPH